MFAGMLSIVGASWASMKNAEKLGIQATNYRTAAKRYTDLSLDVFKVITKVIFRELQLIKFNLLLNRLHYFYYNLLRACISVSLSIETEGSQLLRMN